MKTILRLLSKNKQTSSISTASSSSIALLSATIEPYALTLSPEFLSSRESSNKDSDKLLSCSDDQQARQMQKLWRPRQTMAPRPSVPKTIIDARKAYRSVMGLQSTLNE